MDIMDCVIGIDRLLDVITDQCIIRPIRKI